MKNSVNVFLLDGQYLISWNLHGIQTFFIALIFQPRMTKEQSRKAVYGARRLDTEIKYK